MLAAVVNSHHGKIPFGGWISRTADAVRFCAEQGWDVAASVRMHQWEFLIFAAVIYGVPVKIWVPEDFSDEEKSSLVRQFNLERVEYEFVKVAGGSKKWRYRRDEQVVRAADVIIPVSVRAGGNMERLLETVPASRVIYDFAVPFEVSRWKPPPAPSPEEISFRVPADRWNYLTHWTHTFYSPWCTESKFDFYLSLLYQGEEYSHSVFRALLNILATRKLCATFVKSWGFSAVSFTELPPQEAAKFMRWRPGLVRHYWEPYGIAFDREVLRSMGARPVIYADSSILQGVDPSQRWRYHPASSRRHIWAEEREWRFPSDFDFSLVPRDKFLVMVRSEFEVHRVAERFSVRVISLMNKKLNF